jgi:hypothetical protein
VERQGALRKVDRAQDRFIPVEIRNPVSSQRIGDKVPIFYVFDQKGSVVKSLPSDLSERGTAGNRKQGNSRRNGDKTRKTSAFAGQKRR